MTPNREMSARDYWILLAICFAALLSRAIPLQSIYASDPARLFRPDSMTYLQPAEALVYDGAFKANRGASARPEILRTPGYPLFLAGLLRLTGGFQPKFAAGAQIVVSLGAIVLAWLIAFRLWRHPAAAHLAAALVALDPTGWLYSQLILSDTLFAVLFALHCWTALRLLRAERHAAAWALASGASLAAATFVRPVGYYWIVPLAGGLLWRFRRAPRRAALVLACLLAAWSPPILGWQARNARLTGDSEFSAIQSYNLLAYRAAGVVALRDGLALEVASLRLLSVASLESLPRDAGYDGRFYAACRREAAAILIEHPVLTLRTQIAGAARMLFGPGSAGLNEYLGHASTLGTIFSEVHAIALFAMAVCATISLACRGRWSMPPEQLLILAAVAYLVFVAAGPEAYSRFRLPVVPLMAALAGGFALRFSKH